MNKVRYVCDRCGKTFERYPCQMKGKKHCFCSRECLWAFSSRTQNPDHYLELADHTKAAAHMSALNRELNPKRDWGPKEERTRREYPPGSTRREKLRLALLDRGEGRSYRKLYGRHEHRVVAEQKLGRPLRKGEVVHHIDGDKRNNKPENLMVFASQAEHAKWHKKAGDLK